MNLVGSVQTVTSQNYSELTTEHLSYDAYGRRRDAGDNASIINYNPISDVTKRGYTGQEHVDQLGVINYNARLYDPELGMMLQADTIIPDGPVTQSLNRYSYVFNNPLSYTDPTGHSPIGWPNPYSLQRLNALNTVDDLQQEAVDRNHAEQQQMAVTPEGVHDSTLNQSVKLPTVTVRENDSNNGNGKFNHSIGAKKRIFNELGFRGGLAFLSNAFNSPDLDDVDNIDELRDAYFWDMYGDNGDYWRFRSISLSGDLGFATKGQQIGKSVANGFESSKVTSNRIIKSRTTQSNVVNQEIALGKSIGLDDFAKSRNARTLMKDPNYLFTIFTELRAGTKFSVNLNGTGGDINSALTRAAIGRGSPFDNELMEINTFLKEGGNSQQLKFFLNDEIISNPF